MNLKRNYDNYYDPEAALCHRAGHGWMAVNLQ